MIWKFIRGLMAIAGLLMVYLGVSTSDYYALELGVKEPPHVWMMIMGGLMMILPAVIFSIYSEAKEGDRDER